MELAGKRLRAALYARVSTSEQTCENQVLELRQFCSARGWSIDREYRDEGISGVSARPALQKLMIEARRRRFDVVVVWRLDRLGRSLRDLLMQVEELNAVGIGFVSLNEGIDLTTPAGRLQCHLLAALAEFERERIRERVLAGLARARKQGKRLGRPRSQPLPDRAPRDLSVHQAATLWCVSKSTAARRLSRGELPELGKTCSQSPVLSPTV